MFKHGRLYSGVEPEFFEDDVFRIIQPLNENYSFDAEIAKKHEDMKTTPKNYPENWAEISDLGTSSQKIIELIAGNLSITTQEMADVVGISRRAVAKQLANLQAEGIVKRVGPDKGGHWEIVKEDY
jgi:ATP-dependent DNA helicase RecG